MGKMRFLVDRNGSLGIEMYPHCDKSEWVWNILFCWLEWLLLSLYEMNLCSVVWEYWCLVLHALEERTLQRCPAVMLQSLMGSIKCVWTLLKPCSDPVTWIRTYSPTTGTASIHQTNTFKSSHKILSKLMKFSIIYFR